MPRIVTHGQLYRQNGGRNARPFSEALANNALAARLDTLEAALLANGAVTAEQITVTHETAPDGAHTPRERNNPA